MSATRFFDGIAKEKDRSVGLAYQECHVCLAHGGWNTRPNLGASRYTPEILCSQCWGYGWVKPGSLDATCILHEFSFKEKLGNCYRRDECKHCGKQVDIDSSG